MIKIQIFKNLSSKDTNALTNTLRDQYDALGYNAGCLTICPKENVDPAWFTERQIDAEIIRGTKILEAQGIYNAGNRRVNFIAGEKNTWWEMERFENFRGERVRKKQAGKIDFDIFLCEDDKKKLPKKFKMKIEDFFTVCDKIEDEKLKRRLALDVHLANLYGLETIKKLEDYDIYAEVVHESVKCKLSKEQININVTKLIN